MSVHVPAGQSLYCIMTSSPPVGGGEQRCTTVNSVTARNRGRSLVLARFCVCFSACASLVTVPNIVNNFTATVFESQMRFC